MPAEMQSLRQYLRRHLARTLQTHPDLDRLESAWPLAAGTLTAARGRITAFRNGVVEIVVENPAWLDQMQSLEATLTRDLARIANVRLAAIHFISKENQ